MINSVPVTEAWGSSCSCPWTCSGSGRLVDSGSWVSCSVGSVSPLTDSSTFPSKPLCVLSSSTVSDGMPKHKKIVLPLYSFIQNIFIYNHN